MIYDDDQDEYEDASDTWVPPPPPDDDYEDPNPRAAATVAVEPVKLAPVISLRSKRQQQEDRLAERVRAVLEESGVSALIGAMLDQIQRDEPSPQTTCSSCDHVLAPYYRHCPRCEGSRNRGRVESMADLIRQLRTLALAGDPDPEREREIIAQLREHNHPDLDGLTRWCAAARERADKGGAATAKRGAKW